MTTKTLDGNAATASDDTYGRSMARGTGGSATVKATRAPKRAAGTRAQTKEAAHRRAEAEADAAFEACNRDYIKAIATWMAAHKTRPELSPDSFLTRDMAFHMSMEMSNLHRMNSRMVKETFENILGMTLRNGGVDVALARTRNNPNVDLMIDSSHVSLKTEADNQIRTEQADISKMFSAKVMLKKVTSRRAAWEAREEVLVHLNEIDMLLLLRVFDQRELFRYDLVSVPVEMLREGITGLTEKDFVSPSATSKQWNANILDADGNRMFTLTYDNGDKVRLRNIDVRLCLTECVWKIETPIVHRLPVIDIPLRAQG